MYCLQVKQSMLVYPKGLYLVLFFNLCEWCFSQMLSKCRLFADDNSLQYLSSNIAKMEYFINQELNTLDNWSKQFNPNKTKAVLYTLKSKYLKYCWELNIKKIMFDTEKVRSLTWMEKNQVNWITVCYFSVLYK